MVEQIKDASLWPRRKFCNIWARDNATSYEGFCEWYYKIRHARFNVRQFFYIFAHLQLFLTLPNLQEFFHESISMFSYETIELSGCFILNR